MLRRRLAYGVSTANLRHSREKLLKVMPRAALASWLLLYTRATLSMASLVTPLLSICLPSLSGLRAVATRDVDPRD